jgi:rare lipoprotein A
MPIRALFVLLLLMSSARAADEASLVVQQGKASIYADRFQGQRTASGVPHDQDGLTAASRLLPLGATATVTNLETGQSVQVEITDRGPHRRGRIIDLSRMAAARIGLSREEGIASVRVEADARHQPTADLEQQIARLAARRRAR